ncbi:MAG: hypothetical protein SGCHY_004778 [Lobulomycetales sp.]
MAENDRVANLVKAQLHEMVSENPDYDSKVASGTGPGKNSQSVQDFRRNWKCKWCFCPGHQTPALRKGPLGPKTLCNACGVYFNRNGHLPTNRHQLDRSNGGLSGDALGGARVSTKKKPPPLKIRSVSEQGFNRHPYYTLSRPMSTPPPVSSHAGIFYSQSHGLGSNSPASAGVPLSPLLAAPFSAGSMSPFGFLDFARYNHGAATDTSGSLHSNNMHHFSPHHHHHHHQPTRSATTSPAPHSAPMPTLLDNCGDTSRIGLDAEWSGVDVNLLCSGDDAVGAIVDHLGQLTPPSSSTTSPIGVGAKTSDGTAFGMSSILSNPFADYFDQRSGSESSGTYYIPGAGARVRAVPAEEDLANGARVEAVHSEADLANGARVGAVHTEADLANATTSPPPSRGIVDAENFSLGIDAGSDEQPFGTAWNNSLQCI